MFVTRLTFTKLAHVILVHWRVILIACKMIHELLTSNMRKSVDNMRIWYMQVSIEDSAVLYVDYIAAHIVRHG